MSPGPVTPADVQAARNVFNDLTLAQQELVTNLNDLVTAENSASKIAADKATVDVTYATGETSTAVKSNVTLKSAVTQGSTVTWTSSNSAIAGNGTVTRPIFSAGDATGDVTATIKHGTVQDTKVFTGVNVLKKSFTTPTPDEKDHTFTLVPDGYGLTDFTVGDSIKLHSSGVKNGITFELSYDNTTGIVTVTAISGTVTGPGTLGIDIIKDGKTSVKKIEFEQGSDSSYNHLVFTVHDFSGN
ncbi:immunoglobulin-like domain-containing protein [Sporosarcina sp. FSL K6-5500]|uniref:immunoglobulin-like domain-containing protein n=1 Tax=Sporosarcina sp. FSL K6-5500 TaxID=2921558 RepID=UPI0030F971A7